MSELSLRLSSHSATPTISQSAGLVETAQPIRTMAIKLEDGVLEEGEGGGCEMQSKEKAVEEAEEPLEVTHVPHFHHKSFYHSLRIVKNLRVFWLKWCGKPFPSVLEEQGCVWHWQLLFNVCRLHSILGMLEKKEIQNVKRSMLRNGKTSKKVTIGQKKNHTFASYVSSLLRRYFLELGNANHKH